MHLFPPDLLLRRERDVFEGSFLDGERGPRSTFPCLQVGLQANQEVFPPCACNFISLISLSEPVVVEGHLCSVVDRRELPGDAGPCPVPSSRALPGNPTHFLVLVQFGHLKLNNKRPLAKAKFSQRAYLWCSIQIVGPPASDFVRPGQGTPDALRGSFYGEFFDNGWHRCSFLLPCHCPTYLTYSLSMLDKTKGCMCDITILNLQVKYTGERERCQEGALLKIFRLCLDLALWSE